MEIAENTIPFPVNNVPLLDIARSNGPLQNEILAAITEIIESGRFVGGPYCEKIEQLVAETCETKHAIGCASGSEALLLALMALGIEAGDEVILPSFTFFATASAVCRLGAKPVYVDIEPGSFNIDCDKIEALITEKTKALIPVHLFGQCANMERINAIAAQHCLHVVEDAAQSINAGWNGTKCGGMGDIGCFSFYPTKNLGGFGDGGMMTTNNDLLADRLRLLMNHGMRPRYVHKMVGINSRLDAIQAAALSIKAKHLETWTSQRQENAANYRDLLVETADEFGLVLPVADTNCFHVWNQFTIRIPNGQRDQVRQMLAEDNVGSEIYYPIPIHLQECFSELGYREGDLPETERACREVLSLPIFPELTLAEQQYTAKCLRKACASLRQSLRKAS
jgi:dTDP-4-amino-4,6-dideoxygalactose transaminase